MGHSAVAKLIYGIDLGGIEEHERGLPDWLVQVYFKECIGESLEVTDPHAMSMALGDYIYSMAPLTRFGGVGATIHSYGYEMDAFLLGIECGMAPDYGCAEVDDNVLSSIILGRKAFEEMLVELGCPEDKRTPRLFIAAEYY